jgi:hypothetical protein
MIILTILLFIFTIDSANKFIKMRKKENEIEAKRAEKGIEVVSISKVANADDI